MKRPFAFVILILGFIIFGCGQNTGDLTGRVVDRQNTPLAGIKITAIPGNYTAETDTDGSYSISALPVGLYVIKADLGSITNSTEVSVEPDTLMGCSAVLKTADDIQLGITGNDNPPTVTITSPVDLIAPSSGTVVIRATASDDKSVAKVVFYIDNVSRFTDTASPYCYNWNSVGEPDGQHTIKVRAYDTIDLTGEQEITVVLNNIGAGNNPPGINITYPSDGAIVSGTVNIAADIDDDSESGFRIIFYIDGVSKSTGTADPSYYGWNTLLETNGLHTIKAEAVDNIEQSKRTEISVTVSN